jgi:hypothetical protein
MAVPARAGDMHIAARTTDGKLSTLAAMLNLGDEAIERARAELRAVQEAALNLAIVMARFGQDAEEIAALLRELDAKT